ncbi:MAG TPA: helix-turn-helix transcriptional regulator [Steroidobacteraceae bacterium]
MKLTRELTDSAVLEELGARLARARIDANLTQAHLAEEAGVGKRTIERLEAGRGTDLRMLVRVLRALSLMEGLESLIAEAPQSPLALLRGKGRERKRAGHPRRSEAGAGAAPSAPWKWGE